MVGQSPTISPYSARKKVKLMEVKIIGSKDFPTEKPERTDASVIISGHTCDQLISFHNFLAAVEKIQHDQSTVIKSCR